jgi:carboxypeptidase D
MRFSLAFASTLLLCAETTIAASSLHKRNVFNKAKPVMERRAASEPFRHPELQKRASRFLTEKTEGN